MREILFKAKRVKNGEWIEGSLIDLDIDSGYCYIVPPYKQASTLPIDFLITDVIEDEKKIKDAINLVRTFTKYPDRTASTNSFIESLKLLADTVESQMEEVK